MKRMMKDNRIWKTKKSDPATDSLKVLSDKEIAAQVSRTLGYPEKEPDAHVEPRRAVRLSEAERAARREKNRASARKRLEPVLAAQKGKADWKARAKALRHGA